MSVIGASFVFTKESEKACVLSKNDFFDQLPFLVVWFPVDAPLIDLAFSSYCSYDYQLFVFDSSVPSIYSFFNESRSTIRIYVSTELAQRIKLVETEQKLNPLLSLVLRELVRKVVIQCFSNGEERSDVLFFAWEGFTKALTSPRDKFLIVLAQQWEKLLGENTQIVVGKNIFYYKLKNHKRTEGLVLWESFREGMKIKCVYTDCSYEEYFEKDEKQCFVRYFSLPIEKKFKEIEENEKNKNGQKITGTEKNENKKDMTNFNLHSKMHLLAEMIPDRMPCEFTSNVYTVVESYQNGILTKETLQNGWSVVKERVYVLKKDFGQELYKIWETTTRRERETRSFMETFQGSFIEKNWTFKKRLQITNGQKTGIPTLHLSLLCPPGYFMTKIEVNFDSPKKPKEKEGDEDKYEKSLRFKSVKTTYNRKKPNEIESILTKNGGSCIRRLDYIFEDVQTHKYFSPAKYLGWVLLDGKSQPLLDSWVSRFFE